VPHFSPPFREAGNFRATSIIVKERRFQRRVRIGEKRGFSPRGRQSVITVDCPEISNRLRQRMFLQAITSSLRTIYERNFAKRARSRSSARPASWRFLVRTTQATS